MKFLKLVIVFIAMAIVAQAQVDKTSTLKANNIIFEDDFSGDTVGKFPQKWEETKTKPATKVFVTANDGEHGLYLEKEIELHPLIEPLSNTGDGLKLEFDYKPDSIVGLLGIALFGQYDSKNGSFLYLYNHESVTFQVFRGGHVSKTDNFTQLAPSKWYKITYFIKKDLLLLCIDSSCYYIQNDLVSIPEISKLKLAFGGQSTIKNVKISTVNNTREFSIINTEKKLVTHAIDFEKGTKTITLFSNAYIKDLAYWIKANPTAELEIDGHTDDDGNKELNAALSLARANEVKIALIINGVAASRLTTQGYGSDKPIGQCQYTGS
ncbi:hypothetical protein CJD36_002285 [Flavipsychrobacter stenotrophus]|uniref:OmpA-like domain-containing protein n=1 Tax=Flavipsychrobacter stenotrophus TaxID=2077091 RepID=A0A2S7T1A7_9BACT|nr:OmpA family protein [Flavipsychrobacter stenotrophus]PQJ12595.1 hypothetical protein CJD36_002285 [Flavipsychrobacter stenotrophus]